MSSNAHSIWDENDVDNFVDSDDGYILLKWGGGGHYLMLREVKNFKQIYITYYICTHVCMYVCMYLCVY